MAKRASRRSAGSAIDPTRRYRLIVIGGGPAGLAAAVSAIRDGEVDPSDVLVVERRTIDAETHRQCDGRRRVVVIDCDAATALAAWGVGPAGAPLREMVVQLPDGRRRFFPNTGSWRLGVDAVFGNRRLSRMATLTDIEDRLLTQYSAAGGKARFGVPGVLEVAGDGVASVRVGNVVHAAEVVVVAEGANGVVARARAQQLAVAAEETSHFFCLDLKRGSTAELFAGDLVSTIDLVEGVLVYGFVAPDIASFNMLLPTGVHPSNPNVRTHCRALLGVMVDRLGACGEPIDPSGTPYSGLIVMADRTAIAANAVLCGDSLRAVDPISGAGANAAIADGGAIGQYFRDRRSLSHSTALSRLAGRLRANSSFALELSLLVRENAHFFLKRPAMALRAFEYGLSSRGGGGSLLDAGKNLVAFWAETVLGATRQAKLVQDALQAAGGPPPAFQSPTRRALIGRVHPSEP